MSDEEKKAIEYLKQNDIAEIQYDNYGLESIHRIGIDEKYIILNLIEKQQKEIENLLQDYKQDEKIIQEMAEYIRNIKTDYEQDYCNIENCNYHKTNCSNKCIIDYFRKRCKQ